MPLETPEKGMGSAVAQLSLMVTDSNNFVSRKGGSG